jgi:hypothetical protein
LRFDQLFNLIGNSKFFHLMIAWLHPASERRPLGAGQPRLTLADTREISIRSCTEVVGSFAASVRIA